MVYPQHLETCLKHHRCQCILFVEWPPKEPPHGRLFNVSQEGQERRGHSECVLCTLSKEAGHSPLAAANWNLANTTTSEMSQSQNIYIYKFRIKTRLCPWVEELRTLSAHLHSHFIFVLIDLPWNANIHRNERACLKQEIPTLGRKQEGGREWEGQA